jgi:hypothetical protein
LEDGCTKASFEISILDSPRKVEWILLSIKTAYVCVHSLIEVIPANMHTNDILAVDILLKRTTWIYWSNKYPAE